jgi:glycosyltransferase involved in cell wall biosynthesis
MKRILALVEGMLPSTEIVISQPFEYLRKTGKITYDIKLVRDIIADLRAFNFREYDIVFFLRLCSNVSSNQVLSTIQRFGCKTIYSLDDYFPLINSTTRVGKVYTDMNPKINIEKFCKKSNAVITFSNSTYSTLSSLNPRTFRLNACTDVDFIDSEYDKIERPKTASLVTKVGYAASDHHYTNFRVAIPAIKNILHEFKDKVVFECFFQNKPSELKEFSNFVNITPIPGVNNFYRTLLSRNWDIGIAPLVHSPFNEHKTDNKFREYAACRIPGIYSDIATYNRSVINKSTGILCMNNDEKWYTTMKALILDHDYRRIIRENAYKFAVETYSIPIVAQKYEEIFNSI